MESLYSQLFCLFIFTITGIVIGITFDIFRILRRSFKTSDWITCMQDIIFWIITGIIILFSVFTFNNGEIRSYVFIGVALGVIIYMISISKFIVKYTVIIIKFIKKLVAYPIHLMKKLIINPFVKLLKSIFNLLKKMTKNIKIKQKSKTNLIEKEGILEKM